MIQFLQSNRLLALLFLTAILAIAGTAATSAQMEMKSGDEVTLSGTLGDMAFAAGGTISVSTRSTDDVFVAGGDITLEGAAADHLIAAGGNIVARDIDVRDVIIAGGSLEFDSGTIADDIVGAGGHIMIGEDVVLGGSAVLTGGNVEMHTAVGGSFTASGGNILLTGDVNGDAMLTAGNVEIGDNVTIHGDLTWGADEFLMGENVTVTGEIIETEYESEPAAFSFAAMIAFLMAAIFFLAGLALLVIIIAALFPGLMNKSRAMIAASPLSSLGFGFLFQLVMPLAILVLLISVFGISAGIALLGLLLAVTPFAVAAVSYWIGMTLRGMIGKEPEEEPFIVSRIVWTFIGALLLLVLGIIPFFGLLVWIVAVMIGTGAIIVRGGEALAEA